MCLLAKMIKIKRLKDLLLSISNQTPKNRLPYTTFTTINHTYYFRGPQGCPYVLETKKIQHAVKQERRHNPLGKGGCDAMVNLPVGCFSNLPPDFSAFGNNALNTSQPGFPNKGYRCDNEHQPLIWIDSLCLTYNHHAKESFFINESKHIAIMNRMLSYPLSCREYLTYPAYILTSIFHILIYAFTFKDL